MGLCCPCGWNGTIMITLVPSQRREWAGSAQPNTNPVQVKVQSRRNPQNPGHVSHNTAQSKAVHRNLAFRATLSLAAGCLNRVIVRGFTQAQSAATAFTPPVGYGGKAVQSPMPLPELRTPTLSLSSA